MTERVVPPTRYVVEEEALFDSMLGRDGGISVHYSGTTRSHPWKSRAGETVMDGFGIAHCTNGDVYEGNLRLGMYDGMGTMRYANGDSYEGQWMCGLQHGYGALETSSSSGGVLYVGLFVEGEKGGAGEETGPGYQFVGNFRRGLPNGLGRMRREGTGNMYDGRYVDGRMHGDCTVTCPNGDVFVGNFREGRVHGTGQYTTSDTGDKYTERFVDGFSVPSRDGNVVFDEGNFVPIQTAAGPGGKVPISSNTHLSQGDHGGADPSPLVHTVSNETGDIYEGQWRRTGQSRRGAKHGRGRLTYVATGDVYEGEFENDQREGIGVLTYGNRDHGASARRSTSRVPVRYEGSFHLDRCDGRGYTYFSDGSRSEGFWTAGMLNGLEHFHPPVEVRKCPSEAVSSLFDRGVQTPTDYHKRADDAPGAGT